MPKKEEYEQWIDGESDEIDFGKNTLELACCDCGLIHQISFNVKKFKMTVKTDKKSTKKYRQRNKKDLVYTKKRRGKE